MTDNNYTDVLLENIQDQNKAILELAGSMKEHVKHIPAIRADISELKEDVKTIKLAVRDTSSQVQDHERRIIRLEAKA